MANREEAIPRLELPKRWEFLERGAKEAGLDVTQFVERVDPAEKRIRKLLDSVKRRGGLFEVIFGLSGSGKTTFLNTLPKFLPNQNFGSCYRVMM